MGVGVLDGLVERVVLLEEGGGDGEGLGLGVGLGDGDGLGEGDGVGDGWGAILIDPSVSDCQPWS